MPTGYTAGVADGKITDFRTFALQCARAFGACIMQRDDAGNDPPKHREYSDHNAKRLAEEQAKYERLNKMTSDEAQREADAEYERAMASYHKRVAENTETRNRYNAMLAEVIAWTPPTAEHEGLKKFMIEQLTDSRQFDCHEPTEPTRQTGAEWLDGQRDATYRSIGYHAKGDAEERARVDGANRWIDALYESLNATAAR